MTGKELRRLSRKELLELLVEARKEIERWKTLADKYKKSYEAERVKYNGTGTLAEVVSKINGVYEAAQASADQYLAEIERLRQETRKAGDGAVGQEAPETCGKVVGGEVSEEEVGEAERSAELFFPMFRICDGSMSPTVKAGNVVVALKNVHFDTGDIVAFSYHDRLLVKRVIAGPGQQVDIDADGNVSVDGEPLEEPYVKEKTRGDCDAEFPCKVPENRYFVLGDNRAASHDSRNRWMGCIAEEQVVARVEFRLWPLRGFGRINAK